MDETKLGKRLLDSATKKTIGLVMILILCIPLFNGDTYSTGMTDYDSVLSYLY